MTIEWNGLEAHEAVVFRKQAEVAGPLHSWDVLATHPVLADFRIRRREIENAPIRLLHKSAIWFGGSEGKLQTTARDALDK